MKQYLKMADVFVHDSIEELEQHVYAGYMSKHCSEYAAHAINSHDELVAEVERLREVNEALMVALIDFVMIGDRDLRGLELIQPELESAKAAIEKASGAKN